MNLKTNDTNTTNEAKEWQRTFGTRKTPHNYTIKVTQYLEDALRHVYVSGIDEDNQQSKLNATLIQQHLSAGHSAFLFEERPVIMELLAEQLVASPLPQLEVTLITITTDSQLSYLNLPKLVEKALFGNQLVSIVVAPEILQRQQGQSIFNLFWELYFLRICNLKSSIYFKPKDVVRPIACLLSPFDQFLNNDDIYLMDTLTDARYSRLGFILNQNKPSELSPNLVERIVNSVPNIICFRQEPSSNLDTLAQVIAMRMLEETNRHEIRQLLGLENSTESLSEATTAAIRKALGALPAKEVFALTFEAGCRQPALLIEAQTVTAD